MGNQDPERRPSPADVLQIISLIIDILVLLSIRVSPEAIWWRWTRASALARQLVFVACVLWSGLLAGLVLSDIRTIVTEPARRSWRAMLWRPGASLLLLCGAIYLATIGYDLAPQSRSVIKEPDFEQEMGVWQQDSSSPELVVRGRDEGGRGDSGGYAWLGREPGSKHGLWQDFWVSPEITSGTLVFHYRIPERVPACDECTFTVQITDPNETPVNTITVARFDGGDHTRNQYIPFPYLLGEGFELQKIIRSGGHLRVLFALSNTSDGTMSVYVDDVTFETFW